MTRLLIALTISAGLSLPIGLPAWADDDEPVTDGVHEAGAQFDYGFSGI